MISERMYANFSVYIATLFFKIFLVIIICDTWNVGDARLTISTSTPTPCYGDVVTLMCYHPEVVSKERMYYDVTPLWKENNELLLAADPMFTEIISTDLSYTNLTINITVAHFRNKSFEYSCELLLADSDDKTRPSGELDTSGVVTIDPIEPKPPMGIDNITCLNTSIIFSWTHSPTECYHDRISYHVSWININRSKDNGFNVTEQVTHEIAGLTPNNTYTISVQTAVKQNITSTAISENMTAGKPQVHSKIQAACYNRNFTLLCEISPIHIGKYRNIYWTLNSHRILKGYEMYSTSDSSTELFIVNVTMNTTGEYGCHIELNNGAIVDGVTYPLHPLELPKKPHNVLLSEGVSNISLFWEHDDSCFEDHTFVFTVTWQIEGASDGNMMNATVSGTALDIPSLQPPTKHRICVSAISTSDVGVLNKICLHYKPSGKPSNHSKIHSACYNRNFTLFCDISPIHVGEYRNIYWTLNHTLLNGFDVYNTSSDDTELVIFKVTAITIGDYRCDIELNNGIFVEGMRHSLRLLDSPEEPYNLILVPGDSYISVTWDHDSSCFEEHVFQFIVSWQKVIPGDDSMINITVNRTTWNIADLEPNTTYNVCVLAISNSKDTLQSEKRCRYIKTLTIVETGPDDGAILPVLVTAIFLLSISPVVFLSLTMVIIWNRNDGRPGSQISRGHPLRDMRELKK